MAGAPGAAPKTRTHHVPYHTGWLKRPVLWGAATRVHHQAKAPIRAQSTFSAGPIVVEIAVHVMAAFVITLVVGARLPSMPSPSSLHHLNWSVSAFFSAGSCLTHYSGESAKPDAES